jgi:uncharacterized protein YjbI with pentapeptide repeats
MSITSNSAGSIEPALLNSNCTKLADASAAEKTAFVMQLIEQQSSGVNFQCADLRGTRLSAANLQDASLADTDLRQAQLRGAILQNAHMEEAKLQGADLVGANLQGAVLGGANLEGALFEDANLQGASLRFVHGCGAVFEMAKLVGADLWGARLQDAVLAGADLQNAILSEADLQGADLTGANLQGAVLVQANLRGAKLRGADLRGAVLTRANFENAVLADAKLQGTVLLDCNLTNIHLTGAAIDKTQFQREQLGDALGEELAGQHEEARRAYLALERHFTELGDADAVSWAYRKRRRMQKRAAWANASAAKARGDWRRAVMSYGKYTSDQLTEWLSDYGESAPRVLICMLGVYLLFLVIYAATGSVVRVTYTPNGEVIRTPTHNLADLAVFTLFSMITSAQPPVGLLPADEYARVFTGVQALLGMVLTGLLGFVLGNGMRR